MSAKKKFEDRIYKYARPGKPDPTMPGEVPTCPKGISRHQFARVCEVLRRRRTVTEGDRDVIAVLCAALARHAKALQHLAAEGEVLTVRRFSPKGEEYEAQEFNLWVRILENSERTILAASTALGLTPRSRHLIHETEAPATNAPKPGSVGALRLLAMTTKKETDEPCDPNNKNS